MAKFDRSSSSASNRLKGKRQSSGAKDKAQVSGSFKRQSMRKADDAESILTEVIDEESFGKDDDTIKEDSIVNEVESDSADVKKTKKSSESIAEDSIIKNEFDDDNFAVHNASQSLQARNRVKFGMHSSEAQEAKALTESEKQKQKDRLMLAEE